MTRFGWLAVGAALAVVIGAGWVFRETLFGWAGAEGPHAGHAHPSTGSGQAVGEIAYWTCPMHPSVKAKAPGPCPICGMDLQPVPKAGAAGGAQASNAPGFIALTPWQQQLIGVTTTPVERRPLQTTLRTVGRVDYDETRLADVNLKISGWIQELHVDYTGKPVKKGQPLFTLYSPELVSTQEEYLLALRTLKKLKSDSRLRDPEILGATAEAAPAPGPEDRGPTGGTSDLTHREAVARTQRLLEAARERLLLWDLTEAQVRELEKNGKPQTAMTIHAPASGVVTDKMAVEGMYVKPGMRLYQIAKLDAVWVYADVYEYELPFVREGQRATMSLSYLPGQTFRGAVDYIYPYLDPKTRTAKVRLKVPNPRMSLRPDMYADVTLGLDAGEQLAVPESAVLFSGKRRIVFVDVGDGRFQPREVQLGARMEDDYHVLEGLREGERVVTSANFLLDSESKLKNVLGGMASQHE